MGRSSNSKKTSYKNFICVSYNYDQCKLADLIKFMNKSNLKHFKCDYSQKSDSITH